MAKVLIITFGSYGDLHPFLGVARALVHAGHEVTLGTHEEYRDQVERTGIGFVPIEPAWAQLGPESSWAHRANHRWFGIKFVIETFVLPYLDSSYRTVSAIAPGHDLIISHMFCFSTRMVAEKLGIPWISTALQPAAFFSAYDPPAFAFTTFLARLKFLGPRILSPVMKLLARATNSWLRPLNQFRQEIGLAPTSENPLTEDFSKIGTLALFPELFAAPKPDWPKNTIQVGFPMFDEERSSALSEQVEAFLQANPPPIAFTLGTSIVATRSSFFEIAYEAVKELGCRAVFLVGHSTQGLPSELRNDPRICCSEYEPFSKLFPRSAAIVHQCGIGTTAQALASGRPQLLVPFAHDQPDNARRVVTLGCGLVIPSQQLSVRRLRDALRTLLDNRSYLAASQSVVPRLALDQFDLKLISGLGPFLRRSE